MTSIKRVIKTIERQHPDKVPLSTSVSSTGLQKHGDRAREFLSTYASDLAGAGWISLDIDRTKTGVQCDRWGCVWENNIPGQIGCVTHHPLGEQAQNPDYRFPKMDDLADFSNAHSVRPADEQRFLLGFAGWFWQRMFWVRGMENILLDIAEQRAEMLWLRTQVLNVITSVLERLCQCDLDGIWFFEDWGSQQSLLIRPESWRELFKPSYKLLFDIVHAKGKKVFFHSDGNVSSIINDLVEIGADVLNVQLHLIQEEMLSSETKARACFIGGLDKQAILSVDDADAASAHIREILYQYSTPEGGYIAEIRIDQSLSMDVATTVADLATNWMG